MKEKVLAFVKYNNVFAIAFVAIFFGFSISFAASPTVRESVYNSEETIVAVDNKLILATNIEDFDFNFKIKGVTEDGQNYYAVYSYQTLAIKDGTWQVVDVEKILTVAKEALGDKDLGVYVTKELADNLNYERSYLARAKSLEKERGESAKVVAVEYSGLVGKFLDPEQLVIEGYNPVVETAAVAGSSEVELHPEANYDESKEEAEEEPEEPVEDDIATSTEDVDDGDDPDLGSGTTTDPVVEPEPEVEPEPTPEIEPEEPPVEEEEVVESEPEPEVEAPTAEAETTEEL